MSKFILITIAVLFFTTNLKAQSLNHEKIINTLPENIINKYGNKKALEILTKHLFNFSFPPQVI